eukprot:353554-Chlamydomonas_euryale.AAC.3
MQSSYNPVGFVSSASCACCSHVCASMQALHAVGQNRRCMPLDEQGRVRRDLGMADLSAHVRCVRHAYPTSTHFFTLAFPDATTCNLLAAK